MYIIGNAIHRYKLDKQVIANSVYATRACMAAMQKETKYWLMYTLFDPEAIPGCIYM